MLLSFADAISPNLDLSWAVISHNVNTDSDYYVDEPVTIEIRHVHFTAETWVKPYTC